MTDPTAIVFGRISTIALSSLLILSFLPVISCAVQSKPFAKAEINSLHSRVLAKAKETGACFYSSKGRDGSLRLLFLSKMDAKTTIQELTGCSQPNTFQCNWGVRWYEQCCTESSSGDTVCERWPEPDPQCE